MGIFNNPILSALGSVLNSIGTQPKASSEVSSKIPSNEDVYGAPETSTVQQVSEDVPIIVDKSVRTKYKDSWIKCTRTKPISEIVIHGTGGGRSVAGLLHWMYNDGRPEYSKNIGFFHFAIGRGDKGEKDGLIVNVLDPEYWTYHSTCYKHDYETIGIELLNSSLSNRDPYTDAQYDSLFKLIFDHLLPLYPSITRIVGHRYNIWRWNSEAVAKQYDKNCPGNFDWSKLEAELSDRGYSFDSDGPMCKYNISKTKVIGIRRSDA